MITYYFILFAFCFTQDIYTDYLVLENDTIDVFSYQIPENYDSEIQHPLLVTFHQWGGNENSNYYTGFDEEANNRNWIMLSPYGGSSNNYNHQQAQNMFKEEIKWMMQNFNIDSKRIYMVGGSMGGATGAIYANNHLDPSRPMIAATASASGILDCERRAIEMDGNNSMIEWFGGNWDEVPFEYHRNSAIYFADSTQSMHYNLLYTPLYLDFGVSEPHRTHAEDLYNILLNYNQNIWIDTIPTGSHGYSVIDEEHSCDWLDQFELISDPEYINVNLDQPSRAYWIEAKNMIFDNQFIRIECERYNDNIYNINKFSNSDTLLLHILNDSIPSNIELNNYQNSILTIGLHGNILLMNSISDIIINSPNNNFWENLNFQNNIIYFNISEGNYLINFISEEFEDINLDGIWNVLDIILIVNHIIGQDILFSLQFENADLNDDELINILDIINIISIILD